MRTISRIALALVCLLTVAGPVAAQITDRYAIPLKVSLSGTSRTVTIVPLAGKRIELETVSVQPTGTTDGITIQIERDCTSVTTTSPISRPAVNGQTAPSTGAKFTAYDNTAATGCTALSPDWLIPDDALLPISGTGTFSTGGTNRNINLRIAGGAGGTLAGTLRLQVVLAEAR